jgi:hypothetical protein
MKSDISLAICKHWRFTRWDYWRRWRETEVKLHDAGRGARQSCPTATSLVATAHLWLLWYPMDQRSEIAKLSDVVRMWPWCMLLKLSYVVALTAAPQGWNFSIDENDSFHKRVLAHEVEFKKWRMSQVPEQLPTCCPKSPTAMRNTVPPSYKKA